MDGFLVIQVSVKNLWMGLPTKSHPKWVWMDISTLWIVTMIISFMTQFLSCSVLPFLVLAGSVVRNVVELVDVFPTVSYLAGLRAPHPCPDVSFKVQLCTEGSNLAYNFGRRERGRDSEAIAFSQYPRPSNTPQVRYLMQSTSHSLPRPKQDTWFPWV